VAVAVGVTVTVGGTTVPVAVRVGWLVALGSGAVGVRVGVAVSVGCGLLVAEGVAVSAGDRIAVVTEGVGFSSDPESPKQAAARKRLRATMINAVRGPDLICRFQATLPTTRYCG
jgi:hypothetical protein